mmetsp:Transcript_361/g.619  ORF Transcript_361/g.619 Transcript_361/m.619 type:complete len:202 (-) Transcript_361:60-665(-)
MKGPAVANSSADKMASLCEPRPTAAKSSNMAMSPAASITARANSWSADASPRSIFVTPVRRPSSISSIWTIFTRDATVESTACLLTCACSLPALARARLASRAVLSGSTIFTDEGFGGFGGSVESGGGSPSDEFVEGIAARGNARILWERGATRSDLKSSDLATWRLLVGPCLPNPGVRFVVTHGRRIDIETRRSSATDVL